MGIKIPAESSINECALRFGEILDISISGDPDLFRRVLGNLLRNAAEAAATEIVVSVHGEKDSAVIHVSDNGSGLGMPIARELMRAQGGDLGLGFTSADGACFVVHLPA